MIYCDAANCFIRKYDIESDLIDDSLFMRYNHPMLSNQYWTTKKCIEVMGCESANEECQYWAGFQAYKRNF